MRLFKYLPDCNVVGQVAAKLEDKATPPTQFDDPFEFSPRVASLTDAELYDYFLLEKQRLGDDYVARWFLGKAARTLDEALKIVRDPSMMMATAAIGIRQGITEHVKQTQRRASEDFGVICFTENENDFLMRTFYANYHRGAVIEFDSNALEQSLGPLLKVEYVAERVCFDPRMDLADHAEYVKRTISQKSPEWKNQNEWRGMVLLADCSSTLAGLRLAKLTPGVISSVVFGASCDTSVMARVIGVIRSLGLKVVTKKAKFHDSEFIVIYNPVS